MNLQPIQQSERTPIIDVLRGWALLSVVLMNYMSYYYNVVDVPKDAEPETLYVIFETIFGGKGWTLLAVLFGYGFAHLFDNLSQKGINPYSFYIKRMLWLFVFAFFNSIFYGGDILNDYAFLGIIILLFVNCKPRTLLIMGCLLLFLALPLLPKYLSQIHLVSDSERTYFMALIKSYSIVDKIHANLLGRYKIINLRLRYSVLVHLAQLICFFIGMIAFKINFFTNSTVYILSFFKRVFWISLPFSILSTYLFRYQESLKLKPPQITFSFLYFPWFSIMFLTTSAICWLYYSGKLKTIFDTFKTIGKMTLTNYLIQNVLIFLLFVVFRFVLPVYGFLLTAFSIYFIQLFFSKWWLLKYNFGPAEWLWRSLSYGKWFKNRK